MSYDLHSLYKKFRIHPDPDMFTALFVVSLVALALGVYNNYQIRNGIVSPNNIVNGQKVLPIKNLVKNIKPDSPKLGDPKAKVTMVAFEDFQCPFCRKFHDETFDRIKKEYIDTGKVLYIHQDLAFLGLESNTSAEAANCAKDQGRFWEYRNLLYENQSVAHNAGNFKSENLKEFARKSGLDMVQFNQCFDSQKYKNLVSEARTFANSYGISSTPTFVINGVMVKGAKSFDSFEIIINSELNK